LAHPDFKSALGDVVHNFHILHSGRRDVVKAPVKTGGV